MAARSGSRAFGDAFRRPDDDVAAAAPGPRPGALKQGLTARRLLPPRRASYDAAMADQLNLFGEWERVPDPAPAAATAPVAEAPPPDVSPRQAALFSGPHLGEAAVAAALEALDPAGLRAAAARVAEEFPSYAGLRRWPAWADALGALLARDAGALCDAAQAFAGWPGMAPDLVAILRAALLREAFARLGPTGTTPDGAPAASLLRLAGRPDLAVAALEAALREDATDATTHVELAIVCGLLGRADRALAAWRDALILDPDAVSDDDLGDTRLGELLDDAETLELPGAARAWVPALAAIAHLVAVPSWAAEAPEDAAPARRVVALLAQLRQARTERAPDAAVVALKRQILGIAPGLRERLRAW